VWPFSPRLFRKINRFIANAWWSLCDLWAEKIKKIEIIQSGDVLPLEENAIIIMNHQGWVDIPVLFRLGRRQKMLGNMKWFVKDVIKYVPGVGWGMLFLDCLFLKRNWLADQDSIKKVFAKIIRYQVPCWIMSFVEGTRRTPQKISASQAYARKLGAQPTHHVLLPRTKGFVATAEALHGHISAIYDFTIGYRGPVPSMSEWASGEVKKVHVHVRRFEMKAMPKMNAQLSQWLMNLFLEKDQLLEDFYKRGFFM
jgi:1-acyl-sn-glycerol-3-phosphate acyltransferase